MSEWGYVGNTPHTAKMHFTKEEFSQLEMLIDQYKEMKRAADAQLTYEESQIIQKIENRLGFVYYFAEEES